MLTKDSLPFLNAGLKYSIKQFYPLQERIVLYDILVFLSVTSKTPMFCNQQDTEAFSSLVENCNALDIPLEHYVSCAYEYIMKYSQPGHRIGVSYLLNDKVIEYVGSKINGSTGHGLFVEQLRDDILSTEKSIRILMAESAITYDEAFAKHLKMKKISSYFLAYKKFCNSPLVSLYTSDYFDKLIEILEPFFTYILAKNQIYTPYKIKQWNNSKIEDFNFCPIFFRDRYITNVLVDSLLGNSSSGLGTAVHKVFEDVITKYKKNKIKDLPGIAERYFNSKAFTDVKELLVDHSDFIKDMLTNKESLINQLLTPTSEILIEHTMGGKLTSNAFIGTADLIIINGTEAHILDYKSSKLDPKYLPKNNLKYAKQLSLYTKLLQKERPEITSVTNTVLYTRGLIVDLPINDAIHLERSVDIDNIKKNLKSGMLIPNRGSCFLCRSPQCSFRKRESIWDENGNKKQ